MDVIGMSRSVSAILAPMKCLLLVCVGLVATYGGRPLTNPLKITSKTEQTKSEITQRSRAD
jgi:hypothetical protein